MMRKISCLVLAVILMLLMTGCGSSVPSVGDKIEFGKYQQRTNSFEIDPIKWRVLAKDGKNVLLLSEDALDWRLFDEAGNSSSWESSSLRKWLNEDFYYDAFSADDRSKIVSTVVDNSRDGKTIDYVFLLSTEEVEKYFAREYDRKSWQTQYCVQRANEITGGYHIVTEARWWTRTKDDDGRGFICVDEDGEFYDRFFDSAAVRPAIWVTYSSDSKGQTAPTTQTAPEPTATTPPSSPVTVTPEPAPNPEPAIEVDWQTATYQWKDDAGYTFEATVKVSPWINTKNEAYATAAWNEVNKGKALPSSDSKSWGNAPSSDDYYRPVENVTDVYYCIGNISIKNLTTGWDITASSPVKSTVLWLSACQPETNPAHYNKHPNTFDYLKSSTIGKVYYSNGEERNSTWAHLAPQYTSNKWGPVPFIFAHFDSKAPAYPDGKYISEITDTYFCINNTSFIWDIEMSELTMLKLDVIE